MGTLSLLVLLLLYKKFSEESPSAPPRPAPIPPSNTSQAADEAARKAEEARRAAELARQQQTAQAQAEAARKAAEAAAAAAKAARVQTQAQSVPPPWPQAMPSGLPPFPGGWELDNPPPAPVVARANQLLPTLWSSGRAGQTHTEQTAGRWVTYQASKTATGLRGVTAWRPRPNAAPLPAPTSLLPRSPSVAPAGAVVLVKATPAPAAAPPISTAPNGTAVLRQGASGPAVVRAQQLLGIAADGKFGPNTKAAVIAFQRSHGLTPDGVVGPNTWAALTRGQAA